jgi:hypothetical protein
MDKKNKWIQEIAADKTLFPDKLALIANEYKVSIAGI